jgi:histidinol-phosphatase (PHP family)
MLPPDYHVHTEWSWDADAGSMEASCARAVELGLPSIAFTEHLDRTRWVLPAEGPNEPFQDARGPGDDGRLHAPPLDVDGYLDCLQRCRERSPELRILSGVEFGEPHWHAAELSALAASGAFERVLGSLHSLDLPSGPRLVDLLYGEEGPGRLDPDELLHAYWAETLRMVESALPFEVLAHIDYPMRRRPAAAKPFEPAEWEEELRAVLAALARSGRVLEVNTVLPLRSEVVGWWREAGGGAVSFGSDAHIPRGVAHDFEEAAAMAEAHGFAPGSDPHDFWRRRRVA